MSAETLNELLSGLLGLLCILVLVVSLVQLYRAKKRPPQVEQARVALKACRAMLIRTGRRDWRNKPHYYVRFEMEGGTVDLLCPGEIYALLEEGQEGELIWKQGRVMEFHKHQR